MKENIAQKTADLYGKLREERIENSFLQEKVASVTKEYEDLQQSVSTEIHQKTGHLIKKIKLLENDYRKLQELNFENESIVDKFSYEKSVIIKKLKFLEQELNVTKSLLPIKFNYGEMTIENKIRILEYRIKELQLFLLELNNK